MKSNYILGLIAFTFSLIAMGPLYATSPQKSTTILINGQTRGCTADLVCEMQDSGINFIYMHDSHRMVLLNAADGPEACAVASKVGADVDLVTFAGGNAVKVDCN